jgi:hypothetical protein
MASKPCDWEFYLENMSKELNISSETISKYIKELIGSGWITFLGQKNDGKFGGNEYQLNYEKERTEKTPSRKKPEGENFRHGKNPLHTNTNILTNTDISINTKTKEEKEYKEKEFDFKKKMLEDGFKENLVNDWLKVRKNKKATNSETAYNMFMSEIKKMQVDKNKVLEKIIASDWKGFDASWLAEWQKTLPKEPKLQSVHNFENENAYNRYYDMYVQECMKLGYIPKQKENW